MGCDNSNIETKDFEKISRGYNSLIKSVEEEMKEHQKKLKELNYDENKEKKIELCKNQIKTYEKEKQAAIIAKREEIRNNLLMNNMDNGVLSQYKDRQESNQIIDKKIVNQIHSDYGNAIN